MVTSIYHHIKKNVNETLPGLLQDGYEIPSIEKENALLQMNYIGNVFLQNQEISSKAQGYYPELKKKEVKSIMDAIIKSSKNMEEGVNYCLNELIITDAYDIFDEVMANFPKFDELSFANIYHAFLRVATNSNSSEVVKLALGIISLFENPTHLSILITFARHPDYSFFAVIGIIQYAHASLTYKDALIKCLQITVHWGKIHFLDQLLNNEKLLQDDDIKLNIVLYGLSNCNFPMYLAYPIALKVDMRNYLIDSINDDLFFSISEIIRNLIEENQPFGGLEDLSYATELIEKYLKVAEKKSPSFELLDTVLSIYDLSKVNKDILKYNWTEHTNKADTLFNSKFDKKMLDKVLEANTNDYSTWVTLRIIQEKQLKEYLPKLIDIFNKDPMNILLIEILGNIDDVSALQALYLAIPQIVTPSSRIKKHICQQDDFYDEETGSFEYAKILSYIGKLNTQGIVNVLEKGLIDYDPIVRDGALKGFINVSDDFINDGIKNKIFERLNDEPFYIIFDTIKLIEMKKWSDAKPMIQNILDTHSELEEDERNAILSIIDKL